MANKLTPVLTFVLFLTAVFTTVQETNGSPLQKIEVKIIFQAADPNPQMNQIIEESMPIGSTLFEALNNAQRGNKIVFEYKDYGGALGAYITSINNVAEYQYGPQHHWMIYSLPEDVNAVLGEAPNDKYLLQLGVSSYLLNQPGERILFYHGHVDYHAKK